MVKELRIRANLKQKEVAKGIGLAESSYGFMERGVRPWRGDFKEKAIAYINSVIESRNQPKPEPTPEPEQAPNVTIANTVSNLIAKNIESSGRWFDLVKLARTTYKDTQFETNKDYLAEIIKTAKQLGCPYVTVTWRTEENIKNGIDAPIYVSISEKGAIIFYSVKDNQKYTAKHPVLVSVLSMFKDKE